MKPCATGLIPMAQVQDVQRSADFYRLLGMEVRDSLRNSLGVLQWIDLVCEGAQLMLTRAFGSGSRRPAGGAVLSVLPKSAGVARTPFGQWGERVIHCSSPIH